MTPAGFNFNGRRLKLALVFRSARTAKEAARELGVETGSVFGLIQRMTAEGILRPIGDGVTTRGTEYVLTEDASHALELELESAREPQEVAGTVAGGQEVIVARGGALAGVQAVFADASFSVAIAWAATLGADWLLALSPEADRYAGERLVVALEGAGCKCERGRVDSMLSGRRLRERATDLIAIEVGR